VTLSQQALYWLAYRRANGLQPPKSMFHAAAHADLWRQLNLREHVGWKLCNQHGQSCRDEAAKPRPQT